jgi:MFS family permease
MLLTGALCRRFGSKQITVASCALLSLTVLLPPLAHSAIALGLLLAVFGAAYGSLNVAMNTVAVDMVAALGRPVMPGFHRGLELRRTGWRRPRRPAGAAPVPAPPPVADRARLPAGLGRHGPDPAPALHPLALGGLVAGAGMLLASFAPDVWLALAGFAVTGLGLANLFPATIARAGLLAGSAAVALTSTLGYGGFLLGPPAIGFLASEFGLPAALTTISFLALLAAAIAYASRDR